MNLVKQSQFKDGCEIEHRITIYATNYEFQCLAAVVRALALPYPTGENEDFENYALEEARMKILTSLPAVMVRTLTLLCDELHKVM